MMMKGKICSQIAWNGGSFLVHTILLNLNVSFQRDYATDEHLDRYSDKDIDDADYEGISAAARRMAEARMDRRDRMERGGSRTARGATRSRAPQFLQSDDMDVSEDGLGVARMKRRTRRQYDERPDLDDVDGVEDVRLLADAFLRLLTL